MDADHLNSDADMLKPIASRTNIATVLFFDIVGYTKRSVNIQTQIKKQFTELLSQYLSKLDKAERIILDTGDGAAIGFMQHPEDAMAVAMQFRGAIVANQHQNFPDLQVRIGIHLGPINVVQDMNGQSNMVGDGINDAQRVMSFAGSEQIYVSRAYYDFISRISHEYEALFVYRGAQKDKHERSHSVYELIDRSAQLDEKIQAKGNRSDIKLAPFTFELPSTGQESFLKQESSLEEIEKNSKNALLMNDVRKLLEVEEVSQDVIDLNRLSQQPARKSPEQEMNRVGGSQVNAPVVKVARVIKLPVEASATKQNHLGQKKSAPTGLILISILLVAAAIYFVYIR